MAGNAKVYLGDAVYAQFDGWMIWLTTENGISVTNQIALEPEVYARLVEYVDRLRARPVPGGAGEGGEP